MRYRKVYGKSKEESCVICGKMSTVENPQGLPVCREHKHTEMPDKKCVCGEYLDIKKSKFGAFFVCSNCGPISLSKAEEMGGGGFKLNKKFRAPKEAKVQKETKTEEPIKDPSTKKEKVYTIDELKALWD